MKITFDLGGASQGNSLGGVGGAGGLDQLAKQHDGQMGLKEMMVLMMLMNLLKSGEEGGSGGAHGAAGGAGAAGGPSGAHGPNGAGNKMGLEDLAGVFMAGAAILKAIAPFLQGGGSNPAANPLAGAMGMQLDMAGGESA